MPDIFDDPDAIEQLFATTGGRLGVFGEHEAIGHLEVLDEAMLDDDLRTRIQGARWTFAYATAKLPGLRQRSAITVDGTPYEVRYVLRITDGAESRAFLAAVS